MRKTKNFFRKNKEATLPPMKNLFDSAKDLALEDYKSYSVDRLRIAYRSYYHMLRKYPSLYIQGTLEGIAILGKQATPPPAKGESPSGK